MYTYMYTYIQREGEEESEREQEERVGGERCLCEACGVAAGGVADMVAWVNPRVDTRGLWVDPGLTRDM